MTSGKELYCKTNATGQLDVQVTGTATNTYYIIARPYQRSRRLDCSDNGAVTITP